MTNLHTYNQCISGVTSAHGTYILNTFGGRAKQMQKHLIIGLRCLDRQTMSTVTAKQLLYVSNKYEHRIPFQVRLGQVVCT